MRVLADRYAGIVLDLDGVCYRGDAPVAQAAGTVAGLRARGIGVVFATNNATRTPGEVAAHLRHLGIDARAGEIVTSALAAATMLPAGTRCLVIGENGLREALAARGCHEVTDPADVEAVVVGLDREATYQDLERATRALDRKARFVGTNADTTLPTEHGAAPGAGALLAALEAASGRVPEIAGKPEPPLFEAASARLPEGPRLAVGDRIETDIAGGRRVGWDTALVLTGVTNRAQAKGADPAPTYVLDDVGGLLAPPPAGCFESPA